jgi:NAD(P)-dependent dehydrogenase (short-subunit alcohol dehydrogenase family)
MCSLEKTAQSHPQNGSQMKIEGCTALVTGANRGLGKAYVEALLAAGAAKVYAGARNPALVTDSRSIPVKLDVTSPQDIAAAATKCSDIELLINNAGIMLMSPMLADNSDAAMRREMEVNVFGTLAMIRAFAPVLANNGGGVIANMLSVVSWFVPPANATYAASKHAELVVTEAARIQLKSQGTHVVGVYSGFIDTDMAAGINQPKTTPQQVALSTLEGIRLGQNHVLADRRAEEVWEATRSDPAGLAKTMQQNWDQRA